MKKRTFEIIAKYIAQAHNVTVLFDLKDGECPHADLSNRSIHLPREIGKQKVFAALALIMHEAAHIKHTSILPLELLVKDDIEKDIFNCIEDARIDQKNIGLLPNIKEFYKSLIVDYVRPLPENAPIEHKVLVHLVLAELGYRGYNDKAVDEIIVQFNLQSLFRACIDNLNYGYIDPAYQNILEIKKKLFKNKKVQQIVQKALGKPGQGQGNGHGIAAEGEPQDSQVKQGNSQGNDQNNKGKTIEEILRPKHVWSLDGESLEGPSGADLGDMAFEEKTIQEFKNLLNVKEKRIIQDGLKLDTNNLVSFFTGELDALFKDESHVIQKKSKLLFLLDCSGSMSDSLLDKNMKYRVVGRCCKKMIEILQEVIETEGLNVDYDVAVFDDNYQALDKENWMTSYSPRGGTNLAGAFNEAVQSLKNDYTIEGKRIVIVFTDGDVDEYQIEHVKSTIQSSGTDIRMLIIGIGSSLTSKFSKEIIGERAIVAEEDANNILIDTITQML